MSNNRKFQIKTDLHVNSIIKKIEQRASLMNYYVKNISFIDVKSQKRIEKSGTSGPGPCPPFKRRQNKEEENECRLLIFF